MKNEESVPLTVLLQRVQQGDPKAKEELYHRAYPHLLGMARYYLNGEAEGHSFQPCDLVHEAYLRMEGDPNEFQNRSHFYAYAARAMRHILVEHARAKGRVKRGGGEKTVFLDENLLRISSAPNPEEILDLHEALDELERRDPVKAAVIEHRYFGGLTREETATVLALSERTTARHWKFAKTWLRAALEPDHGSPHSSP